MTPLDLAPRVGKSARRRLRILLASMKWDYGKRERGLSFEHQTFFPALGEWERTAALRHFDFMALAQRHGVARMSEMLLEEVDQFAPDLLVGVWFDASCDPRQETLAEIGRRYPCVTLGWFCDSHWRYEGFDRRWAEHLDLAVTTSRRAWERGQRDGLGPRYVRSQWGAAPGYRRLPDVRRDIDVSFVGQPHGDRKEALAALRRCGLSVETFGTGFERRLTFDEMVAVFNRSKVNLNFARSHDGSVTQIKARVFEVCACGGYLLSGDAEDLADYYAPGREIDSFTDVDELIEKARLALARPGARRWPRRRGGERSWNTASPVGSSDCSWRREPWSRTRRPHLLRAATSAGQTFRGQAEVAAVAPPARSPRASWRAAHGGARRRCRSSSARTTTAGFSPPRSRAVSPRR